MKKSRKNLRFLTKRCRALDLFYSRYLSHMPHQKSHRVENSELRLLVRKEASRELGYFSTPPEKWAELK